MFKVIFVFLLFGLLGVAITQKTVVTTTGRSGLTIGSPEDAHLPADIAQLARCQARCYNEFGRKQSMEDIRKYDDVRQSFCDTTECSECLLPCDSSIKHTDQCTDSCSSDQCKNSCHELLSYQTELKQDLSSTSSIKAISTPVILCKNVAYKSDCKTPQVAVYLKWKDTITHSVSHPLYVVRSRQLYVNGTASDWRLQKLAAVPFVEASNLYCDRQYQFQITTFLPTGQYGRPEVSKWTSTPHNYTDPVTPLSIHIDNVTVLNQRPSLTVSWDGGKDASCYYILWYLGNTQKLEEFKVPKQFSHQITDLDYATNYSIQLTSYDETFKDSSPQKRVIYHVTPDCLKVTNYNHTICAPLQPMDLKVVVTTPDHEDKGVHSVNVTLTWNPPLHTHNGSDVTRYELVYSKKPPNVPHLVQPDHGTKSIEAHQRHFNLSNLHNHNLYSFKLYAETKGGRGEAAEIERFIGLTAFEVNDVIQTRPTPEEVTSHNLNAVELLAVVLVPIALFFVLIFVVFFVFLRKRRKLQNYTTSPRRFGPVEELNPIYDGASVHINKERKEQFNADGYEIDYACLDFISVVGEGAFGKVVKAEYYPNPGDRDAKTGKIVAVKMLRDFYTGDESRSFVLEIQAMKNLGHHPYIVSIIGCCLTGPKLCLVMDFCSLGDLRNYLRKYREKLMYTVSSPYGMMSKAQKCYLPDQLFGEKEKCNSSSSNNSADADEMSDVSEAQLLSYARQITMGMEFLEERKFVHRDLAARNILLLDQRHIKISDFGLTRDVYETNVYQPTSARKLPYKWMAIESLFSQRFTIKSDVWSFGIVLWEIVTLGGSPYPSIPLKDLYGLLNDGYRMEKPENCSTKVYQIMLSCWHPNPHSRPTFSQLRQELEKLLEETRSYIDLSVEVSEDYFNESTNESNLACSTSEDNLGDHHLASPTCSHEYLESTKLFVDVHETNENTDTLDEKADTEVEMSESHRLLPYSEEQNNGEARKPNRNSYCEMALTQPDNKTKYELKDEACNQPCDNCSTKMKLTKSYSCPPKDNGQIKTSLKDSLRNVIANVGKMNYTGSPKPLSKKIHSTKKCVSLSDMTDLKDVKTTAL
ncbi:ephrin type-A receptor 5-like isoform X1 [Mya arenaria]|uniref:ephrin type-A receptor 5-like isoform X1 n=1 Tax=Mya arenaria TaxID=6604 RepID=UPI0022E937D2|nr:ephrin type-A receptor 5-like isoform X1 [Mya arenaria]